jgi:hypothetical protein
LPRCGNATSVNKPTVIAIVAAEYIGKLSDDQVQRRRLLYPERREPIRFSAATAWKGETLSARPARETSLFGTSAFGGADRDEKARSVVALSRVPRWAGFAGSLRLPVFSNG